MKRTKPQPPPTKKAAAAPRVLGGGGVSDLEVRAFAALFQGYSKAHGVYDTGAAPKVNDNGKIQGKARTEPGAPSLAKYEQHLRGTGPGLGIIMLRDDDTCLFGVIDYDVRTMDHAKAEQAVQRLKLPLVLCRSKSGGGHFYVFTTEPVPAATMRDRLDEWKALLNMSSRTETFPKQSARFNENDIGNWINLPYFNADATDRYMVAEGQPAPLHVFLRAAEAARVTPEEMERAAGTTTDALFGDGPPCLQVIHGQGGFAEGSRNEGMMAVMVYLKKRFGDGWEQHVDEYNAAMAGLSSKELVHLTKSNGKKDYAYPCKRPPINACCQRRVCVQREFGVGDGPQDGKGYQISALTRYDSAHGDEPMWGMEINGKRVLVSNSAFYSRDDFNRAAMAQANVLPIHMTPAKWLRYLAELIAAADVVPMPEDSGPSGLLWSWVENFTTQQANALEREEVWLGKPYREEGSVYFRSADLFRYLDARKVRYTSPQALWQLLRTHGATQDKWHIKGRFVNVWVLPASAEWDDNGPAPRTDFAPTDDY